MNNSKGSTSVALLTKVCASLVGVAGILWAGGAWVSHTETVQTSYAAQVDVVSAGMRENKNRIVRTETSVNVLERNVVEIVRSQKAIESDISALREMMGEVRGLLKAGARP